MTWRGLSVFGLLLLLTAFLMLAPASLAWGVGDGDAAGAFVLSALMTSVVGGLLILAQRMTVARTETVGEFSTLLAAYLLTPIAAAAPIKLIAPHLTAEAAYFEMVSTFTTTGATVFDRLSETHPAINLWRAMTAWLGGFIALVAAFALMAPRNIGGFEVRGDEARTGAVGRLRGDPAWAGGAGREAAADRAAEAIRVILPIYLALTGLMAFAFAAFGQAPLRAVVAAMGVISTSGVKATDDPVFTNPGYGAEAVAAVFLVLAATRRTYGGLGQGGLRWDQMREDAELRILAAAVIGVTAWLYLRHFIGALELEATGEEASIAALWGALFTALSFATTTGYESASWDAARAWSGLGNPSLVLFGLAIMGGGVATTAGGVKLLRAYALYKHGAREMERLVRPSSISGSGARKRGLRREGAQIAWVFVMLFVVAIAATMMALTLTGLDFDRSLAASVAALANTGPVFTAVTDGSSWLTSISPEGRAILVIAMVLGRVELLALIAMLNPDYWR